MKNSKGYNRKVDRFYKDIMNYVNENVLYEDEEEMKAFKHALKDTLEDLK